jgi:hypothetical protein
MSVEADFGQSDWVAQAGGIQLSWEIAWEGVYDDWRFGAVSFQSDFGGSRLERISETFINAGSTHFGEVIRAHPNPEFPPNDIVAWRFAVVVIPSH